MWSSKKVETKPLAEIIFQNTTLVRKNRESKILVFIDKAYQKIVEKLNFHSNHFTTLEFKFNINELLSESEFTSNDKTVESFTSDEYKKISVAIADKFLAEKFTVKSFTECDKENVTIYHLTLSWNLPDQDFSNQTDKEKL